MTGLGGVYTNPVVVKGKTLEKIKEPEFTQYMETGIVSTNAENTESMRTKIKRVKGRKRHASPRKTLVHKKKRKLTHRKPVKNKKNRQNRKGSKKRNLGKQRRKTPKDRF